MGSEHCSVDLATGVCVCVHAFRVCVRVITAQSDVCGLLYLRNYQDTLFTASVLFFNHLFKTGIIVLFF